MAAAGLKRDRSFEADRILVKEEEEEQEHHDDGVETCAWMDPKQEGTWWDSNDWWCKAEHEVGQEKDTSWDGWWHGKKEEEHGEGNTDWPKHTKQEPWSSSSTSSGSNGGHSVKGGWVSPEGRFYE